MKNLYDDILNGKEKLSIIGLGYVGMPIAVEFASHVDVIGFDLNEEKNKLYKNGIDPTNEVGNEKLRESKILFTSDENQLRKAKFHIVAVPTPINKDNSPDLSPVETACIIVGRNLVKDSVVVFESTVYPGVTEEICLPILEKESGLKCGLDFKIGYSPERINPGDKEHKLENIVKIVSGMDEETLDLVAKIYELVVKAGVYKAESIKIAEAAKVIENSQRDINIAFMNELSIIFNKMNIDTKKVLRAAETKWNFLKFAPGLVGGHCIGVDPYYLTYKAEQLGYHSQIILAGRRINDDMGKEIAINLVKKLISNDIAVKNSRVAVLGFTFKENCPDTRNTKVIDIVNELKEYGVNTLILDPLADEEAVHKEYNIELKKHDDIKDVDAVIVAVSHQKFRELDEIQIENMYKKNLNSKIIFDIKGIYEECSWTEKFIYWSL